MKKTVLMVLLLVVPAVPALAAKMVVELRSGNKVVVEYTGTIDKVSMEGTGDAIAGFHLEAGPEERAMAGQTPEAEVDKKEDGMLKLRWADPKMED